ncbi:MAG: hypothetical protein OXC60_11335 [Litoreibacter sp.]|nr:hypothetical protein [Litoreibacter sp.]
MLENCKLGVTSFFGPGVPNEPTHKNTIRAEIIRFLLLGGCEKNPVHAKGVQIFGAWIESKLNLEAIDTPRELIAFDCRFSMPIEMRDARLGSLNLSGSRIAELSAQCARFDRNLMLRNKFCASGTVDLGGARIGGQLNCDGGQFEAEGNDALNCHQLVVEESVFLQNGFRATGPVDFGSARIGGQLTCSGGQFEAEGNRALMCQRLFVAGSVFLSDGFRAAACVDFGSARIGGQLNCSGGQFEAKGNQALTCDQLVVEESLPPFKRHALI